MAQERSRRSAAAKESPANLSAEAPILREMIHDLTEDEDSFYSQPSDSNLTTEVVPVLRGDGGYIEEYRFPKTNWCCTVMRAFQTMLTVLMILVLFAFPVVIGILIVIVASIHNEILRQDLPKLDNFTELYDAAT